MSAAVPVDPLLFPAVAPLCVALRELPVLALRSVAFESPGLLALEEQRPKGDGTDPFEDRTGGIERDERLSARAHRHDESTVLGELVEQRPGRTDGGGLDEDTVERGVLGEAPRAVPAVDEDGTVAGSIEVLAGRMNHVAVDVDGVDVRRVTDLGEDGGGVPDADADDENRIALAGVERFEEAGGGAGCEDGRPVDLGRAVGIRETLVLDERLAGNVSHREGDPFGVEGGLGLVFEAVDHVLAQDGGVHTRCWAIQHQESRACSNDRYDHIDARTSSTMEDSDILTHALIGAVVTTVLSWFVPLAPIAGGAVTAYFQSADEETGVRSGALSGLIALVPLGLLGLAIVGFVGIFTLDPTGTAVSLVVVIVALLVGSLYVVGLSALGGYLGAYLVKEYELERRSEPVERRP